MNKKTISAAMAGALAVSLFSACGASSTPQTISDVTSSSSSAAASTAATAETTASGKQEMTFVLSNEPDGLDPSITNNSFAQYVILNCFEGLVTYDASSTWNFSFSSSRTFCTCASISACSNVLSLPWKLIL